MLEPIISMIPCIRTGPCGGRRRVGCFGAFIAPVVNAPLVASPEIAGPSWRAEWRRQS